MTARPRIAIAGFQHESNSFSPFGTGFQDFETADGWPALTRGADILDLFPPLNIPLSGFVRSPAFDVVPIVWASAEPSGPVSDDAFERISQMICNGIADAKDLDGIYLDLHGAMVTASHEDGEGELLGRIRAIVGNNIPILVSLDMHANITEAMVTLADAMTVYRTYPHVDMAETGARCVALMRARLWHGPLCKAFRKLPYLIPLSAQCTGFEPFKSIYARLPGSAEGGVLSVDIAAGFPASDIYECGPAIVAYGRDRSCEGRADEVLQSLMEAETAFDNRLFSVEEAVAQAMARGASGRPVLLADVQDNPGAGGTADTTTILRALVEAKAQKAALSVLWDPETARVAHAAGVGAEISVQLGGRYGYNAQPFFGRFRVEALSDGTIIGGGAIMGGVAMALGPMAQLRVLETDADIRVVISSIRFQCLDQMLFKAMGIDPRAQAILVLKSTVHFRADFEAIAGEILMVEAPGANACRLDTSVYRKLRPGVRAVASA